MTHELMKAFTTWWSASSIACDRGTDCRSAYEAGWEAHAAAPVVTKDSEIEFQKWWEHTQLRHMMGECTAKQVWNAAFGHRTGEQRSSEREAAELAGRAIEKQVWRAEIMGRAIEAFRDGRDETARTFRNLANELFEKL